MPFTFSLTAFKQQVWLLCSTCPYEFFQHTRRDSEDLEEVQSK